VIRIRKQSKVLKGTHKGFKKPKTPLPSAINLALTPAIKLAKIGLEQLVPSCIASRPFVIIGTFSPKEVMVNFGSTQSILTHPALRYQASHAPSGYTSPHWMGTSLRRGRRGSWIRRCLDKRAG
jgi:hypothetical protein